jgi:N,N'-diacetyllegionaminate synthase
MVEKKVEINGKLIGGENPPFIIAEAGVNHNGDINLAKKLIDAAVNAKADAIKFQTFTSKNVVTKTAGMCSYQVENTGKSESQLEMIKKFELSFTDFKILKDYCDEKGIIFLSTPHSPDAVDFLDSLVPLFKVGSGDLTNLSLLEVIACKKKPIILSTGMANLSEIKEAIKTIKENGTDDIILLQCTTNYPCGLDEVNLRVMETFRKNFEDLIIGYSDHSINQEVIKLANKYGAKVIEFHFTLDKALSGPDHQASFNPEEMLEIISTIHYKNCSTNIDEELVLGSFEKIPSQIELEIASVVRKSIIANTYIPAGTVITRNMLIIKRPGTGMLPKQLNEVIGKQTNQDIPPDALISIGMIQ